ncbi:hypothetical protein GTP23_20560 [Pseudoduganella sp. FT93W]|uniref:Uncharacterized protein n=1 Tax=Duganella fentianensis TaxID=2692177 RepID=A0A845I5P0_9BURK|nr:hypothetical protein [Duganella fentianensis]MYN47441.1 hypothetical protein [Duganella fentianensis]
MSATIIASTPRKMAAFPATKDINAAVKEQFSVEKKEWLECQDFIIASNAQRIGWLPLNVNSLRHFKAFTCDAIYVTHLRNDMITSEMRAAYSLIHKASHIMKDAGAKICEKIKSPLEMLREAPLEDKREVLRYAQIIPTAIAAAYIGVSEHALSAWYKDLKVFGENYAGSHCYSLEELKMIASNRYWICSEIVPDDRRVTPSDDEKSLDEVVMLDYQFAAAFTDMTHEQMLEYLPRNQLSKRPYRLSDVEKIRIRKLNGTH